MSKVSLASIQVVICGGGIIGSSVAYYLAKKGVASLVVERSGLACAASGKAGGFLAKDWCDDYELGPLATLGFEMHQELAKLFPNTDYRPLDTLSITTSDGSRPRRRGSTSKVKCDLPAWIDGTVDSSSSMGDTSTTAQVHPYKLTHAMMTAASEMVDTRVHIGVVEGLELSSDKTRVTGVKIDGEVIPADIVVIAMGPWSSQASKWLNIPPVKGQRAHSIILKPSNPITATAVFVEYRRPSGKGSSPEIYPRPDGDVYVAGMGDDVPLPTDPDQIHPNPDSCLALKDMTSKLSSAILDSTIKQTQACYLPISPDGLPIIGEMPNIKGAYIATGHSCWGILNAPSTGAAIAELIVDGQCSLLDLSPFLPDRFF